MFKYMAEKVVLNKKIQSIKGRSPFVYLDNTLLKVMGFSPNENMRLVFDVDNKTITISGEQGAA